MVIELRPDTQLVWQPFFGSTFWTVTGIGTPVAAFADESPGTYVQVHEAGIVDDAAFGFSTATLATNQRVNGIRIRADMLQSARADSVVNNFILNFALYGPTSGTVSFVGESPNNGQYHPSSNASRAAYLGITPSPSGVDQINITAANPGIAYSQWWASLDSGQLFTQAVLDGLAMRLGVQLPNGTYPFNGNGLFQIARLSVEVDVRTQPTVVVHNAVGTSLGGTVTWTSTLNDGDVQSAWEMAVFDQATASTPGFDPGTTTAKARLLGTGGAQQAQAFETFQGGPFTVGATYVTYVRVAKLMGLDTNGVFAPGSRSYNWFSGWATGTMFITPVDTATYTPQIPTEGVLGCHTWTVTGGSRGGTAIKAELPWNRFQWGRKLQEVSTASVTFPRSACLDVPFLADLRPWEHELAFWRDSEAGPQLEWVGPITGRAVGRDEITLRARDWFALLERRRMHADFDQQSVELATAFSAVFVDALGPDNSANIGIIIHTSGITGDRQYFSTQYRRAADILRELGRAGVDWTMIGRTLLAGGVELGIAPGRLLLDDHVLDIDGDENGESAATDVIVVGTKGSSGTQAVGGIAIANDPRGVLETVIQANDIQDNASALSYAASSLALLGGGVPRSYQVTLAPDTQSGYGRLIPGARWPVDLPSMGLFETLRLRQVDVSVTKSDDGQVQETVKVELTSLGQLGF
jgi:hypothetical protein